MIQIHRHFCVRCTVVTIASQITYVHVVKRKLMHLYMYVSCGRISMIPMHFEDTMILLGDSIFLSSGGGGSKTLDIEGKALSIDYGRQQEPNEACDQLFHLYTG